MTPDRIPFGFDLDADGVTLRRNESEQRALAIVAELRRRGMTLRAIAEELEKRGIPTKAASHAKA